jgi:selenocysteine lyase/cysteine desulfurase
VAEKETRGEFLGRAAAVASGAAIGAAGGYAVGNREDTAEAAAAADLTTWAGVRSSFALADDRVQLASFLLASHPQPVRDAIERHRRELDANAAGYLRANERRFDEDAAAAIARYLGGTVENVALTGSTTMGLGIVCGGLQLARGDDVLTSVHDFYATHEALRLRARETGARVRRVRLYDEPERADPRDIVRRVVDAVRPETRYVALTWVHSSSGVKLPIAEIAAALTRLNRRRPSARQIAFAVDGVHGFGVEDVKAAELGCDFFVSGCHKWLFGPRGTGVVWASARGWSRVRPRIPTFDGRSYGAWIEGRAPTQTPPGPAMTPGGFHAFEHRWALAEAVAFHEAVGPTRVAARTHDLTQELRDELSRIPRVRVRTPRDAAGLVCCELPVPADVAVDRLAADGVVASVTPYATRYLRFGPSIVNDDRDLERAIEAVRVLA